MTMPDLDTIRRNGEQQILAKLRSFDRRHQAMVLDAIGTYGSVANVPASVWQRIENDMEAEVASAILILLLASDEATTLEIRRQGLDAVGATSADAVSRYEAEARAQAQRMARQTTDTLRSRLADTIDGQREVLRTKPPTEAVADVRGAVEDVFSPTRSERIAVTGTTETISRGQLGASRRAGDGASTIAGQSVKIELRWRTEQDGLVCPICAPLDGTNEEVWGLTFENGPPGHPNCLLPGTRVAAGVPLAAMRFMYEGPAVHIRTAKGRRLSVTANHKILTPNGFVRAKSLALGDYVICDGWQLPSVSGIVPDENGNPTVVDEVFRAFSESLDMPAMSMPLSTEHFHGDGQFANGDVDIVSPNCLLWDAIQPAQLKESDEFPLCAYWNSTEFSGLSDLNTVLAGMSLAAHGIVGCAGEFLSFSGRRSFHPIEHTFAPVSWRNASSKQSAVDCATTDTKPLRSFLDAFPGFVKTDEIVNIYVDSYRGHVYDLQTYTGVYIADGVVTSNCRCALRVVAVVEPALEAA